MTEDSEDWHVRHKRYTQFISTTDLGKLFIVYEQALVAYWQTDVDDTNKLIAADTAAKEATHAFVTKLMELAKV